MSSDVYDGFDSYEDMQAAREKLTPRKKRTPIDIPTAVASLGTAGENMAADELIAKWGMSTASAIAFRVIGKMEVQRTRLKREVIERGEYVEEMGD